MLRYKNKDIFHHFPTITIIIIIVHVVVIVVIVIVINIVVIVVIVINMVVMVTLFQGRKTPVGRSSGDYRPLDRILPQAISTRIFGVSSNEIQNVKCRQYCGAELSFRVDAAAK